MKTTYSKQLDVRFFCTKNGTEPVREWLKSLDREDKKILGEDIKTVQFGWPLGMPLIKSLGDGLWEIRSNLTHGRIARVIFFTGRGLIVLAHGFIKKTQKTPLVELELAKRRRLQFEREEKEGK